MIFLATQSKNNIEKYIRLLKAVCSLSRLFSDSKVPYLYYRAAENIFCKAFGTMNLARTDGAFDSHFGDSGIGLKTFVSEKGNKFEKIAEFNKLSSILRKLQGLDLAYKLAEYRNERIDSANRRYNTKKAIYHCVARTSETLKIFDVPYHFVNINNIRKVIETDAGITFEDGIEKYSFNRSKSTLFKKFQTPDDALEVKIKILDDPFDVLLNLFSEAETKLKPISQDYVILPLYSETKTKGKYIPDKDGLNKWRSEGRPRDFGEVKVRVPSEIYKQSPNFFPAQGVHFKLQVPTGETFTAGVYEQGRKALMTNPNKALAEWLLRDLLKLRKGEKATYERLAILGFDSVKVTKVKEGFYTIDVSDSSYGEDDEDSDS